MCAMAEPPSGTVTFLFSDVEGSTQLLERHGAAMGSALARHHELFEQIVERHGGVIFETVGDAVYAAFSDAGAAAAAAVEAQRALADEDWGSIGRMAVRIAIHTGSVERRGDHYFGSALFRVARLQALGYGEQTLLSGVTAKLAADALPAGASLRDLGSHRLKDLGEPEHVYQLDHSGLRTEFPALKSLDAHPHNLPVQLSSFIGREAEVAELGQLVGRERVITLLGPGGIGKTRLALQVAAEQLEAFPEGVFLVDLSPVRDPELVPGAIAAALGLRERPDQPIRATLAEHLASRRILLVLDNLEQLLPAAAASVAELLGSTHDLRLLVTSRAALRIRGEREYGVAPLAVGAADRLEDEVPPAVALFLERARAMRSDLQITAETGPIIAAICERLDGLPLAIELAAARLRLFSLAQLDQRLTERLPLLTGGARDLPKRQQTLRAAIAWSDELLSEAERRLFARVGVFMGGFSIEAAEAVAASDLADDVLDSISALVDQSLVRAIDGPTDEPRFTMLETIREYAVERAEDLGELAAAARRHAEYLLDLAERESPNVHRAGGREVLKRLDADYQNLRAALGFAIEHREEQLAIRLVCGLWNVWDGTYRWREGLALTERVLGLPEGAPSSPRAEAVLTAGILCLRLGKLEEGRRYAERSLALYRRLGDRRGTARALHIAAPYENPAAAIAMLQESLAIQREVGHDAQASTLYDLALLELDRDNLPAAAKWATEALSVARVEGDEDVVAGALDILGALRFWGGELEDADALFRQAEDLLRGDDGVHMAEVLSDSAAVAAERGDRARAERLLARVLTMMRGVDWAERMYANVLEAAALVTMTANPLASATLWGTADALRERDRTPRFPVDARFVAERVRLVRAAATDSEFDASYQRGLKLSADEAMAMVEQIAGGDGATTQARASSDS
jgi:predicted ATPase/class 3 adenylate cyclase